MLNHVAGQEAASRVPRAANGTWLVLEARRRIGSWQAADGRSLRGPRRYPPSGCSGRLQCCPGGSPRTAGGGRGGAQHGQHGRPSISGRSPGLTRCRSRRRSSVPISCPMRAPSARRRSCRTRHKELHRARALPTPAAGSHPVLQRLQVAVLKRSLPKVDPVGLIDPPKDG